MKTLFDSTRIKEKEIKNRFIVAPMTRVSADLQGVPTREMHDYYAAFAVGGFAGIVTEGIYTDAFYSKSYPNQPGLINRSQKDGWKSIIREIHHNDTFVIAQLMHAGAISQVLPSTKAPSGIIPLGQKLPHYGGGSGPFPIPCEMTKEDIKDVINGFIYAAKNAVDAEFDGIELHAANGYLLDQFITPYLNLRTDEYGGSIKNRVRIIAEITEKIKKDSPQDFILGLRISEGKVNNLTYRWPGGSETARLILKEIKEMPIDYLHIAAEHFGWEKECRYDDGTSLTGLAKELLDCPVIANGKLHHSELAANLLDTDQADLFAIGKMALANADFVQKVINNVDLVPFDAGSLHPNPSLFSDEKHARYLQEYERQ